MPVTLPQSIKTLLQDKGHGFVTTYDAKGNPHVTLVWLDVEGDEVTFNTEEGRRKPDYLRRDPRVVLSVQDPKDPRAYAVFYGKARMTHDDAEDQIDRFAKKYLGKDTYPFRQPGKKRVKVLLSVDRIGGLATGMKPWS